MTVKLTKDENRAELCVEGRLDTVTAPELEAVVDGELKGIDELTLDFAGLEYISSAGLRVLLHAEKMMRERGGMTVKNVNETVREILDITGFADILNIA